MLPERKRPLSNQEFKDIYSKVTRLTVEVILQIADGVVLILRKEPDWHGFWHIPGGTVLYKEPLESAVKRIAKEELGVDVDVVRFLAPIEYPTEEEQRGFGWTIGLAYLCALKSEVNHEMWARENIQVFSQVPEKTVIEQKLFLKEFFAGAK